jgi:hypothetical protein
MSSTGRDGLVSPFDDAVVEPQPLAPRPFALAGKRVTLLSISKPKSAEYLNEIERLLVSRYGVTVARAFKPTFTKPAPRELIDQVAAGSDAVIEALAD